MCVCALVFTPESMARVQSYSMRNGIVQMLGNVLQHGFAASSSGEVIGR